MPIILCRHGATVKNLEGGTDDPWTRLHADGLVQSAEAGTRLLAFCRANGITRLQPITSGYVRTEQTCDEALKDFSNKDVEIMPRLQDDRIGEIKFLPRDVVPTKDRPGIFSRVIDGPTLSDVLARLTGFAGDHLQDVEQGTALVAFGHRTTHRLLAMIHLKRDIAWMESLPRMDNCELWVMKTRDIEVLHPGYPAGRDEADPRRDALKPT